MPPLPDPAAWPGWLYDLLHPVRTWPCKECSLLEVRRLPLPLAASVTVLQRARAKRCWLLVTHLARKVLLQPTPLP